MIRPGHPNESRDGLRHTTLDGWFSRSAGAHPRAVAIDFGPDQITYGDLDRQVGQCATFLSRQGFPRGSRIGLAATGKPWTFVGYLGILRAGHTVVPLGTDGPASFNSMVAGMARLAAVIADPLDLPRFEGVNPTAINPRQWKDSPATATTHADAGPDDTAYILFTSGSTGRPKAVPIKHRHVVAYLSHVVAGYELGPGARLSQAFALTFDPSVFDLFGALVSGSTVVVPRNRELLAPASYVAARGITHWYSVPTLASHARHIGNLKPDSMPGLRFTRFIGEPLPVDVAAAWHRAAPRSVIDNVYGPTEVTVSCAEYRLGDDPASWPSTENGTVPIGTVYPHLDWRVLTESGDGEGELLLRGPQRFDGYLDPSDNTDRFVHHHNGGTTAVSGDRIDDAAWYRTGDRVRRTDAGLVHLGRMDRQVKVRGHRIELGDVEAALRLHPEVQAAAVVCVRDARGDLALAAAVCGDRDSGADLAAFVRARRPAYMAPATVVRLDRLPVNRAGKVDYQALTDIVATASESPN